MICPIGSNTRDTVLQKFKVNNLIASEPRTDGSFLVLKPEEFDRANAEMGDMVLSMHNIANRFWVREGNTARFNNTFANLVDVVDAREGVVTVPAIEEVPAFGLPTLSIPENWVSPC